MAAALHINGERTTGQDVRTQNTMAVVAVANILKTSLGPVGLDKVRPRCSAAALMRPASRRAPIAPARRPPRSLLLAAARPPVDSPRSPALPRLLDRCSSTTSAT